MSETRWRGERWFNHERVNALKEFTDPRGSRGIRGGKIQHLTKALAYDSPWAFTGCQNSCGFLLEFWTKFSVIPKRCRKCCWKVVVKPKTVLELYHFHMLQGQMHILEGYSGKCGVDYRWYTHGSYAGFWYNNSLEEGQRCYKRTRELMESMDHFHTMFKHEAATGKSVISLKKGCTEMQHPSMGGIPSSEWEEHVDVPIWNRKESRLNDMFSSDNADVAGAQPTWLIDKIIYSWCEYAHQIGDPTYRDVLGHDPFEYTEDTYHQDEPSIKLTPGGEVYTDKGGDKEVDDQSVGNPN